MDFSDVDILYTEDEVQAKVKELAARISQDYAGQDLLVVGILKGAFVFMADLIRHLDLKVHIDFMDVSSYGAGAKSSGEVRIMKDLEQPIEDKNLLIVEDIIDSGLTLKYIIEILGKRKPRSVKICTFLDKPSRRKVNMVPDYNGFSIPDKFVVGYGLDYAEDYRHLPAVCVLKPEIYEK